MKDATSTLKTRQPFLKGLAVFIIVIILTQGLAYQRYLIHKNAKHHEVLSEINSVKYRLKTGLNNGLFATRTLAFIIEKYGIPEDFDKIAKNILESNKYIDALELTKKGVITNVYPLKGNEAAIGYNVLSDSSRNKEAYKAIKKRELFFAGPFELKQGGIAVVGRLPVFINNNFEGFSAVIIKLSTLLKAAGVDSLQDGQFIYQLSKINPSTLKQEFFLPSSLPIDTTQSVSIEVPDGEWKLCVMAKNNKMPFDVIAFSILGFFLSLTAGLFAWYLARQPEKLNQLVDEKTSQLRTIENNFKTTLERVSDAFVALDNDWRYTFLNDGALATHPLGRQGTLGKVIWEVHPEMKNTIFSDKYHEAMQTGKVVEIESYYAPMNAWFSAKIYPSDDGLTIFYRDITTGKKTEQEIILEKSFSESILNSLPGIFYLYDHNGKIIRWNKNLETISGYSTEEICLMHPLDFFDEDEKELLERKINAAFENDTADIEAHLFTKEKVKIPYYFSGRLSRLDGIDYRMGVGIDISERKKADEEIKKSQLELRALSAHLQIIREEERTRIAREIHDDLGQQLTGLKMDASWMRKKIKDDDLPVQDRLSGMISLIDDTVKTVRRISSELRPGILDDLGLIAALEWQGQEFEKRTGISLKFHTDLDELHLEKNLSTSIFRIYQEALTNIAKHANAHRVETTIEKKESNIMLIIKDDGQGFDVDVVKNINSWGLVGMKERAFILNGELNIQSSEKGTIVTLIIPYIGTNKNT